MSLDLCPCEQPWQIARLAARFVHEEALEQRQALHCAKPGFPPTEGCIALQRDDLLTLLASAIPGDALIISGE